MTTSYAPDPRTFVAANDDPRRYTPDYSDPELVRLRLSDDSLAAMSVEERNYFIDWDGVQHVLLLPIEMEEEL